MEAVARCGMKTIRAQIFGRLPAGESAMARRIFFQSNRVSEVIELILRKLLEALAFVGELLVDLHGFFGHCLVSLLGASDQGKIRPGGKAFVAVRIQPDAEHDGASLLLTRGVRHRRRLNKKAVISKAKLIEP